jgi:hypothetical protein
MLEAESFEVTSAPEPSPGELERAVSRGGFGGRQGSLCHLKPGI